MGGEIHSAFKKRGKRGLPPFTDLSHPSFQNLPEKAGLYRQNKSPKAGTFGLFHAQNLIGPVNTNITQRIKPIMPAIRQRRPVF